MSRPTCRTAMLLLVMAAPLAGQELQPTLVRVDSAAVLTQLARAGFEVAGIQRVAGVPYAVVVATAAQQATLAVRGLAIRAGPPPPPTAPVQFHGYQAILAALDSMAAAGRIHVDTIGRSWEGRPIVAAEVGLRGDAPERPNVLFIGAHHAREWISAEMALRLLEYLVTDASATSGLAERDVWVIPVENPDGYVYSFGADRLWRKNRRLNPDGTVGVDLNRNYPSFWGVDDVGSSASPGTETYRGTAPASEPETQAIMAFHAAHPPVVAVSYHSYGDFVLYPYSHVAGALPPDLPRFVESARTPLDPPIADRLPGAARAGYHPGPAWQLYPTNGDYTEWAYRTYGTLAYTVELTAGCCDAGSDYGFLFPDDSTAVATAVDDNLPFAWAAIAEAGGGSIGQQALETVWPETRVLTVPNVSPTVLLRAGTASTALAFVADSLDRGTRLWRWRASAGDAMAGTRLESAGLGAPTEVIYADGAERETGWSGWARDSTRSREGTWHWHGETGQLTSPAISLAGVSNPQLALWIRHRGSLFLPEQFATVDVSRDGGASWVPILRIEGASDAWYPVSAALPSAPDVRLRVVTQGMPMDVDAVHVFGATASVTVTAAPDELAVSENPVRSNRLYLTWQPEAGDARLSVFTFTGILVYRSTVPATDGQVAWDLTDLAGATVENGAYAAVLELGGRVLRRRLFVARGR